MCIWETEPSCFSEWMVRVEDSLGMWTSVDQLGRRLLILSHVR